VFSLSNPFSTRQTVHVVVGLEPVYNALNSFSLLSASERLAGLNAWVVRTPATLTPERRHTNRLVFEGLGDALAPGQHALDFPTYLKDLAEQDPYVLRDRVLERLRSRFSQRAPSEETPVGPDSVRLLSDVHAYLTCVEYVQVDTPFDRALHTEVHTLLNDAPAMHHLIVSHLEELWKTTFAAEWRRVQSSLRWQVEMFTRSLDEDASIEDTFHTFTGRDLPADLRERLTTIPEIMLVPSWHMGRHVALWESEASARLFFSEPPNYDITLLRSAPVGRAELRARLDALADETRMRILELLLQQDELHAQDIIAALDLSQSGVSRHLKQLVSMGYLYERRGEGANKTYRLSSVYFERTARAIEQLVSAEDTQKRPLAETHEEAQSQGMRRFLDKSGRLTMWPPAKQRDKLLILEYLAGFFERGRMYSEKEVNDLLLLRSTIKDSAALRRALYEYRFMNRTRDGSRYWLIGSELSEEGEGKETL
jgi:predicted transcriptional regulator